MDGFQTNDWWWMISVDRPPGTGRDPLTTTDLTDKRMQSCLTVRIILMTCSILYLKTHNKDDKWQIHRQFVHDCPARLDLLSDKAELGILSVAVYVFKAGGRGYQGGWRVWFSCLYLALAECLLFNLSFVKLTYLLALTTDVWPAQPAPQVITCALRYLTSTPPHSHIHVHTPALVLAVCHLASAASAFIAAGTKLAEGWERCEEGSSTEERQELHQADVWPHLSQSIVYLWVTPAHVTSAFLQLRCHRMIQW